MQLLHVNVKGLPRRGEASRLPQCGIARRKLQSRAPAVSDGNRLALLPASSPFPSLLPSRPSAPPSPVLPGLPRPDLLCLPLPRAPGPPATAWPPASRPRLLAPTRHEAPPPHAQPLRRAPPLSPARGAGAAGALQRGPGSPGCSAALRRAPASREPWTRGR